MKIKVIKGKIDNKGVGEILELDAKDAELLIKDGYAEKADGKSAEATPPQGGASSPPPSPQGASGGK